MPEPRDPITIIWAFMAQAVLTMTGPGFKPRFTWNVNFSTWRNTCRTSQCILRRRSRRNIERYQIGYESNMTANRMLFAFCITQLRESQQSSSIIIQYFIPYIYRSNNNQLHTIKSILTINLTLSLLSFIFHILHDQVQQ